MGIELPKRAAGTQSVQGDRHLFRGGIGCILPSESRQWLVVLRKRRQPPPTGLLFSLVFALCYKVLPAPSRIFKPFMRG